MGCCLSKDEDRFDDRSALLSKEQTTRDALEAAERIKAKQQAVGNGAYRNPVTSVSDHAKSLPPPPKKESSCCSGGGCSKTADKTAKPPQKKKEEVVNPTLSSVDLLGLDQPPSPPNAPSFATAVALSPPHATKPLSPRRSSSVSFDNDETDGSYTQSAPSPIKTGAPAEVLSSLMPPRPSPPPTPLAPPPPAPTPTPPTEVVAPVADKLEESVDLEDGNDDGEDDGAPPSTAASTTSSSSNVSKSKKKKKKKGKK